MFVGVLVSAALLFLMAAAALPDKIAADGVDLREYYHSISRRYWLLFAAQWLIMNAVSIWAQARLLRMHLDLMSPAYLVIVAAVILAIWRNRWVQTIGLIGFIALYTTLYFGRTLA